MEELLMSVRVNTLAVLIAVSCFLFFGQAYANPTDNHCKKAQRLLDEFRAQNNIVGIGIYAGSCYLFSGSAKLGEQKSISQHNLFQIGSITKSYFSAILLQFESESENGEIPITFNINQKLKRWLPQYSDWVNVTIKQLLNMTSGIYNYTEMPNFTQMILKHREKIWTANEIVNLAYKHKPNTYFAAGKGWHYSDTNYIIVG